MRRKIGAQLKRRLRRLEIAEANSLTLEFWITEDDGTLRCQGTGECMTPEAFDKLYANESPGIIVLSADDSKL